MIQHLVRRHPNLTAFVFGCCALLTLWGAAEGVSLVLLHQREAGAIQITKDEWQEDHPTLGYRPKARFSGREKKWRGDTTLYDVTYTFDEFHRRVTPATASSDQFALFFGDSFTFGQGVQDHETLPAQFAAQAPQFHAYNYGCGGYGPQNLWVHVHRPEFRSEIAESGGIAVYTFIHPQVFRATGSLRLLSLWGSRLPCLVPEPDGLRQRGLFEEVFPWRCRTAAFLMKSPTLRCLNVDWPRAAGPAHYAYTARILAESRARLQSLFPGLRFVILLYPAEQDLSLFIDAIKEQHLEFLDYTRLLKATTTNLPLALGDGHPTPENYRIVAEALARDLPPNAPRTPVDAPAPHPLPSL